MGRRQYYVYIMTNRSGTLYTGVGGVMAVIPRSNATRNLGRWRTVARPAANEVPDYATDVGP